MPTAYSLRIDSRSWPSPATQDSPNLPRTRYSCYCRDNTCGGGSCAADSAAVQHWPAASTTFSPDSPNAVAPRAAVESLSRAVVRGTRDSVAGSSSCAQLGVCYTAAAAAAVGSSPIHSSIAVTWTNYTLDSVHLLLLHLPPSLLLPSSYSFVVVLALAPVEHSACRSYYHLTTPLLLLPRPILLLRHLQPPHTRTGTDPFDADSPTDSSCFDWPPQPPFDSGSRSAFHPRRWNCSPLRSV